MRKVISTCADCGKPCIGDRCPYSQTVEWYCDRCGADLTWDDVFNDGEDDLCLDCLKDEFRKDKDDD